jgi:hypothetical protein
MAKVLLLVENRAVVHLPDPTVCAATVHSTNSLLFFVGTPSVCPRGTPESSWMRPRALEAASDAAK